MRKMVHTKLFSSKTIILLITDILLLHFSSLLAIWFRFDLSPQSVPAIYIESILKYAAIHTVTILAAFFILNMYNRIWRFAGLRDFGDLLIACSAAYLLQIIGMTLLQLGVPRSYYPLNFILFVLFAFSIRFAYRIIKEVEAFRRNYHEKAKNVMLIGAGDAGSMIANEMQNSRHLTQRLVCIIDDDEQKHDKVFYGSPVIGGREKILEAVQTYNIQEIIIAIPSARREDIKAVLNICKDTNCQLHILPGIYQLINGELNVSKLRKVEIEDLLGREPVRIDLNEIMDYVQERVVLVTGGGGSIGSELCRQLAAYNPKQLIIFDIYENNAYAIQQELLRKYPNMDLRVLIGSVRDSRRLTHLFAKYNPDIVYHAAAHKHVPLMEDSPNEAIKNNVFGTYNTALIAAKSGVKKFVLISSDKAVNPTSMMGATKRVSEMIVQAFDKIYPTEFVAVRFGNVLGSSGSVVPLFKKQIENGGPVTVTHPDMVRYFMTIPEAVSLVLQAGSYAKGGEIFILDMGEPVKILDLAENLIRLSGYKVYEDIDITFTGLRQGEKLFEEMLLNEEGIQETENKLIYIGNPIKFNVELFFKQLDELEILMYEDTNFVFKKMQKIITNYSLPAQYAVLPEKVEQNKNKVAVTGRKPVRTLNSNKVVFDKLTNAKKNDQYTASNPAI